MRSVMAMTCVVVFVLASCGGESGTSDSETSDTIANDNAATRTSDIDVCALLTAGELTAVFGTAPSSEPTEPIANLTGCKWGGGLLFVQIRPSTTLITAPLETDCPSADIGEASTVCFGSVKFLTNGIHATVSTIENVEEAQLVAIATTLLPKLQS